MTKIILLPLFLLCLTVNGQVNLSGKFIEGESGEPIDFLRIIIQDQNDGSRKDTYTDSTGHFNISTASGDYNLYAIYLLNDTLFRQKDISLKEDFDIGLKEVKLGEDTLGVITIDANIPIFTRKPDRLVFNVENSIAASAGNALEALALTPGVNVNGSSISIAGKGSVFILINDRSLKLSGEDLANYLATISANDIKQIEVITTPPAKYNADGNSGIIRIVLKEALPNQWKLSLSGSARQGTFTSGRVGMNFEINKNKFSFYSSLGTSAYNKRNSFNNNIFYEDERWINDGPTDIANKYISGRLGMNYKLSDNWQIGMDMVTALGLNSSTRSTSSTILNYSDEKLYSIRSDNDGNNNSINLPVGVYSIIKLDTSGSLLTVNLDYFNYRDDKDGNTIGASYDSFDNRLLGTTFATLNENVRTINNYSGNVDFEFPMEFMNLNFGAYLSSVNTSNSFSFFNNESGEINIDTNQTNEFNYLENRQALYFSGSKSLGEKFEFQVGLRAENIQTTGYSKTIDETNEYDYLSLFPSFYALYKINKKQSLNLTYSRRISRPSYEMLNPFKTYLTPLASAEGNPFLLPSFANNLELNYDTRYNNLQLFYSHYSNDFGQVAFLDVAEKSVAYSYYNYLTTNSIGIYESYYYNKIKWWIISLEGLVSYEISTSSLDFTPDKLVGTYSYVAIENSFILNKKRTFKIYLDYTYNFQSISGLSESSAYGSLYAAFQAKFFDKKLSISLSMTDVLRTARPLRTTYSNGVRREIYNYYDNQQVRLSLYYNFGNKNINVNKVNSKNKDEKNRLNN